MKALCFDRWYGKPTAAAVAKELEARYGSYTLVGLVECPEGAWGILYVIDKEQATDWHILSTAPDVVHDVEYERRGGGR